MYDYLKKNISKYKEASEKYRPKKIKLLFIAESPPFVEEGQEPRYIYFEKIFKYDFLFKSIAEVLLPEDFLKFKNNLIDKEKILVKLRDEDYFLIDACDFPVNQFPDEIADKIINENFEDLINNIKKIADADTEIVLVKENIYKIFLKNREKIDLKILNSGFSNTYRWIGHYRGKTGALPFPSVGWQTEFKDKLKELLGLEASKTNPFDKMVGSNSTIWVNVNRPTKKLTIHTNPKCEYVLGKRETNYKGLEEMKRDGGWVSFDSLEKAKYYCKGIEAEKEYGITTCC